MGGAQIGLKFVPEEEQAEITVCLCWVKQTAVLKKRLNWTRKGQNLTPEQRVKTSILLLTLLKLH